MADVLGLSASILQVISTGVQVSVYLYTFAETVSSAEKSIKEIFNDILFTTSVLEQLRAILESERKHRTASKEAISTAENLANECSNVFGDIQTLLEKHFPKGKSKGSQRLNALKWPFIQPKIELYRANLEKHKTKLILMAQVLAYAKMVASERRSMQDQLEQERRKLEALVIVSHRANSHAKNFVNTFGLTEVFTPSKPASVDVVFVHGFFGHPKETFTSAESEAFWPADLLPPILEDEGARVLTYGYELWGDGAREPGAGLDIASVMANLGIDLASNRQIRKANQRPLVWIAHSLGGIVVKGALLNSSTNVEPASSSLKSILTSTYGIVFLSTPHDLRSLHLKLLHEHALQRGFNKASKGVEELEDNFPVLQAVNRRFLSISDQYELCCFREMLEPKILDDRSARLSMFHREATCIYSDHHNISKFETLSSPGFDLVCAAIQTYVQLAPRFIQARWTEVNLRTPFHNDLAHSGPPPMYEFTSERRRLRDYRGLEGSEEYLETSLPAFRERKLQGEVSDETAIPAVHRSRTLEEPVKGRRDSYHMQHVVSTPPSSSPSSDHILPVPRLGESSNPDYQFGLESSNGSARKDGIIKTLRTRTAETTRWRELKCAIYPEVVDLSASLNFSPQRTGSAQLWRSALASPVEPREGYSHLKDVYEESCRIKMSQRHYEPLMEEERQEAERRTKREEEELRRRIEKEQRELAEVRRKLALEQEVFQARTEREERAFRQRQAHEAKIHAMNLAKENDRLKLIEAKDAHALKQAASMSKLRNDENEAEHRRKLKLNLQHHMAVGSSVFDKLFSSESLLEEEYEVVSEGLMENKFQLLAEGMGPGDLDATEEERSKAKEEVSRLLAEWTIVGLQNSEAGEE